MRRAALTLHAAAATLAFAVVEAIAADTGTSTFDARLYASSSAAPRCRAELAIRADASGERPTMTLRATSGEWITVTPEGFFAASARGAELLQVAQCAETTGMEQLYQVLYRPDLVREKLAGDPNKLVRQAAAKLDLDKVMASGAAPGVRLLPLKEGDRITVEEITIEAEIADRGGGIGRIEWRVNGVTLGIEPPDPASVTAKPAKPVTVRRKLTLDAGENVIEAVAYNAKGLIASKPAILKVVREDTQPTGPPRLYVLAAGINDYYDSAMRLAYASSDAKALADALQRAGERLYERIEVTTVRDADVTAARLDKLFGEISQRVRTHDVFVFFVAGHGKTIDGRYYFLPQDFRYQGDDSIAQRGIGQDRWQEWLARIRARKTILLFDTCESGSLAGDRVMLRGLERVAALNRMSQAMGRTVLTASTDNAPALEGYRGHGVFTYALLDALGRGDSNGNGLIEITELAAHVDQEVPELSWQAFHRRQVPQMRIVGSNFPLVRQTVVLPSGGESLPTALSSKPTHFVIAVADVFTDASAGSAPLRKLSVGTPVTRVKTESEWSFIAQEGNPLGYVATADLLPIQ